ncbi:MAG: COX15/CtaA family protein [Chloroflexota bacterium]|nr:COX15/CtaA family protein [Chloroflexota bacterium]
MTTAQTRFRAVALLGLIAAIAQVTLGGMVRRTGSGVACPGWPLCHGQLMPPLDYHTMLEYSHRLSATVVGLLVVIALYLAWRHYRGSSPAVISTSAGTILVIAAAILGGLTVLSELTWWVRLIHLGLAELVVASMAVAWLSGGPAGEDSSEQVIERPRIRFDRTLMWGTIIGVMVMILYGSYIVGAGYGSSCGSWPLCQGWGIPRGIAFEAHMGHRYLAVILFALVAGMGHVAWRRGAVDGELRWLTVLTGGFLVAEILVGAFTVWLGFTAAMKSLHLTVATLMWASAVLLAAVYLRPDRFRVPSWRVESVSS